MHIKDMRLTPKHQEIIDAFTHFLGNNERIFIIDAIGGGGKTTLCKYLLDITIPEYNQVASVLGLTTRDEVYVTAMHNKAASVLVESGLAATTIQSHLGLVLTYFNGEYTLVPKKPIKGGDTQLIFIDEASTLDRVVFNRLKDLPHAKIVMVGDRFQTPPVKEARSLIYNGNPKLHTLKEIMRTDIPELKEVYEELREQVEYNEPICIPLIPNVVDVIDADDGFNLAAKLMQDKEDAVIIGYKNTAVVSYNSRVRDVLNMPHTQEVGDTMVVNSATFDKGNTYIPTDTRVTVMEVNPHDSSDLNIGNLPTHSVSVITTTGKPVQLVAAQCPLEREKHLKFHQKNKQWKEYYAIKEFVADLRHLHAITVHKSQGSTYDYVFIDLDDISNCPNTALARQLVYVAVTRARKRVYLIGSLKERIGGMKYVQEINKES